MADQLAAIASGVASLSQGAARCFDAGTVNQTVVEMERGFLFVMAISDGSSLAVLATTACDVGGVGYELATLVARAGEVLTPACGPSSKPPSRRERRRPERYSTAREASGGSGKIGIDKRRGESSCALTARGGARSR